MADAFELIEKVVLTSDQASVTFSSLGSYEHLQLRIFGKTTYASATSDEIKFTLNSTGTFAQQRALAYQSTNTHAESGSSSHVYITRFAAGSASQHEFGSAVIDIVDYRNTNKKTTVRHIGGFMSGGTGNNDKQIGFGGALWNQTSAVTSIVLSGSSGNLKSESVFCLYGWSSS